MPIDGKRGQEPGDLHRSHLRRMPLLVKEDEPFDRLRVSGIDPTYASCLRPGLRQAGLGAIAVMPRADRVAHLIQAAKGAFVEDRQFSQGRVKVRE